MNSVIKYFGFIGLFSISSSVYAIMPCYTPGVGSSPLPIYESGSAEKPPIDAALGLSSQSIDGIGKTFNNMFLKSLLGNRQEVPVGVINVSTPQIAVATSNAAFASGYGALYVRHALLKEAEAASTQKIVSSMVESSELQKAKMIDVYRRLQSQEMEYKGVLANKESELTLSGAYSDENGNGGNVSENRPSYQYFKTACERKKQAEVVVGTKATKNRNIRVSKGVSSKAIKRVSNNSDVSARESQLEHYEEYCTKENKELGLCEEEATIPNGDVDSNVALSPKYVQKEGEETVPLDVLENMPEEMSLTATYSDEEYKAAKDFAENVIGHFKVLRPNASEINDVSKSKFVQTYRGNAARISLAEYSTLMAVEKRKEIAQLEGGVPVSETEIKNKLVEEMYNSDSNINLLGSNKLGVDLQEFLALNIKTKLELDKDEHLGRIELLIASYLSQKENGADKYNMLESLKARGDGGI